MKYKKLLLILLLMFILSAINTSAQNAFEIGKLDIKDSIVEFKLKLNIESLKVYNVSKFNYYNEKHLGEFYDSIEVYTPQKYFIEDSVLIIDLRSLEDKKSKYTVKDEEISGYETRIDSSFTTIIIPESTPYIILNRNEGEFNFGLYVGKKKFSSIMIYYEDSVEIKIKKRIE